MRSTTKQFIGLALGCLIAVSVTAGGFRIDPEGKARKESKETKAAMTPEQVIASIRTAVAAKPGNVMELEAENEGGKILCEIEILAHDGKTWEVEIDVATNTVIELESDDEDDEDESDEDDNE